MIKSFYRISMLLVSLFFSSCGFEEEKRYVYNSNLMYTVFDILIYSNASEKELTSSISNIWKNLEYLEYELSPAGDGFVGKLNREGFISQEENPKIFTIVSNFIDSSKKINKLSNGAFDLTVYPLVRLWGFYVQDGEKRVPSSKEIADVLQQVGMDKIVFTNNGILLKNNAKLDLGAIAKGYAVDTAIDFLKENTNISAGFVNAGGNIRVFGNKPDGTPWKIGIRNPNGEEVSEVVSLYDGDSIATSGDYEQFFEVDGVYYHHIFNPTTGSPVKHNLASVSIVLNGKAEDADLLATTFLSLGIEKTREMLTLLENSDEFALFFITRDGADLFSEANEIWIERK